MRTTRSRCVQHSSQTQLFTQLDNMSTGNSNWSPNGQGLRLGKTRVRPFILTFTLKLTERSARIRGLPKRRSPAVAPALPTTSGTTVCPDPSIPTHPLTLTPTHTITSCQPLRQNSVASQDSEQLVVQQPPSPSLPLRLLAHL